MKNLIFRDPEGLGNPRNGGKKAEESGAAPVVGVVVGGDGVAVGEAARVVDGGVRGLFLQYGEEKDGDQC